MLRRFAKQDMVVHSRLIGSRKKMDIRSLNAMVDSFDATASVEARKESTFSQNNCGEKDISTITWSHCGNT